MIHWLDKNREITVKFKLKHVYLIAFILLLAAYIIWETYWYSKVGLAFIKWHTHIAFLMFIFSFPLLLLHALKKQIRFINEKYEKLLMIFFNTFLCVFLLELIFIFTPLLKTRLEIKEGSYLSAFSINQDNIYHSWRGNESHTLQNTEFYFNRTTNSLGYSDKEWTISDTSKIRILCNLKANHTYQTSKRDSQK
jgi:hypothetical protein